MKKKFAFLMCLLVALVSCDKSDIIDSQDSTGVNNLKDVYSFIYKGKKYSSEYTVVDSVWHFADKEVNEVMNTIAKFPNSITVVDNDVFEYFDNEEDYNKTMSMRNKFTRAISVVNYRHITKGHLELTKDRAHKGKCLAVELLEGNTYIAEPKLNSTFNDCISSLQVFTEDRVIDYSTWGNAYFNQKFLVRLYEHTNFGGRILEFTLWPNEGKTYDKAYNLSNWPLLPGNGGKWNDQISSYRIEFLKATFASL